MSAARPTPDDKRRALEAIRDAMPGTTNKVQCDRLLAALPQFGVTTFEAMRYLDVYDPRARVLTLRREGAPIKTYWETVITEGGERHRVGLYVMGAAN